MRYCSARLGKHVASMLLKHVACTTLSAKTKPAETAMQGFMTWPSSAGTFVNESGGGSGRSSCWDANSNANDHDNDDDDHNDHST